MLSDFDDPGRAVHLPSEVDNGIPKVSFQQGVNTNDGCISEGEGH